MDFSARCAARFNIISGTEATTDDSLATGLRIGPYQLVRLFGEGGIGPISLAERVDDRIKRSVALKLPKWTWTLRDVNLDWRASGIWESRTRKRRATLRRWRRWTRPSISCNGLQSG